MSYLTQMLTLAYHNFFSAAVGMALAVALIRGISRRESKTLGNFWVDTTRASLWVLLPSCVIYALLLVSQGVVQNFRPYDQAKLVQSQTVTTTGTDGKATTQTVTTQKHRTGAGRRRRKPSRCLAPTAAASSMRTAHIRLRTRRRFQPDADVFDLCDSGWRLTVTLGRMTRLAESMVGPCSRRWRHCSLSACSVAYYAEAQPNPLLHSVNQHATATQAGGNMEGKEVRFGIANSALFATVTTDASCGAVNSMHDSFMPLGGMVPLVNIMLGEVIFGGVGAGLYGMLIFVVLAVFIAG